MALDWNKVHRRIHNVEHRRIREDLLYVCLHFIDDVMVLVWILIFLVLYFHCGRYSASFVSEDKISSKEYVTSIAGNT